MTAQQAHTLASAKNLDNFNRIYDGIKQAADNGAFVHWAIHLTPDQMAELIKKGYTVQLRSEFMDYKITW